MTHAKIKCFFLLLLWYKRGVFEPHHSCKLEGKKVENFTIREGTGRERRIKMGEGTVKRYTTLRFWAAAGF